MANRFITELCHAYKLDFDKNYKIAHLGNIYGQHDRFSDYVNVVSAIAWKMRSAKLQNNDLYLYGDGSDVRSLTYLKDLARLLPKYLEQVHLRKTIISTNERQLSIMEI